jgi:uncharacterized membrane protein YbhN (UPF0104 family)
VRLRGRILRILAVVVVVALIALFARKVDWSQTWGAIRNTSPWLLAAAALTNILSVAIKGLRWHVFLRPIGVASLLLTLRATYAGAALNHVLVANSGEAARVIFLARAARAPTSKVLATAALERIFEFLGFFALLAISIWLLELPPEVTRLRAIALIGVVALVLLLVFLIRYEAGPPAQPVPGRGFGARLKGFVRGFLQTLPGISSGPRYAAAIALTAGVWAFQLLSYHYTARAAHFDLPLAGSIAALLAANVGFALRVTPGNVGVFQMVYAMTAVTFGMDKNQAIGVSLLLQAQQMLPIVLLGLIAAPQMLRLRRDALSPAISASPGR